MSHLTTPPSPTREAYITHHLTSQPTPNDTTCPICYESYTASPSPIIRTHCNHTFHRECFITWLGKEDVSSANSCPNCRAVCFPNVEHREESGLVLDMSVLYRTMRGEYVERLPVREIEWEGESAVSDEEMMRAAFGKEEEEGAE
jgi:hypothetical protein